MTQKHRLQSKERWAWAALVVALVLFNGYQFWLRPTLPTEDLTAAGSALPEPVASEQEATSVDPSLIAQLPSALSDYQLRQFKKRGLNYPEEQILADLLGKPQLIPMDPVLGGTMFFIPEATRLLSDRWVMATYEDGHVQGRALFEYQVSSQGEISWRVLATADN